MSRTELLLFMRAYTYAVQTSVSPERSPQAAVVGIAVTDSFEIIFDSVDTTRKVKNLSVNSRIAFVMGGWTPGDERTVQYEGEVDWPQGSELERLKSLYFATFPDGQKRLGWSGITYMRARPAWIRYSDYNKDPEEVVELDSEQLKALR